MPFTTQDTTTAHKLFLFMAWHQNGSDTTVQYAQKQNHFVMAIAFNNNFFWNIKI